MTKTLPYLETRQEFKEALETDRLVVLQFTATWCGPCKRIAPYYAQLAGEFPESDCYKVDVDEADPLASSCKVRCMPTFHFYRHGKKVGQMEGVNKTDLKALFNKHI